MITMDQVHHLMDHKATVRDNDGDKIGSVGQVYLDDATGEPAWVTVKTGLFGTSETFVPLELASVEGDDVRVPYEKAKVKDAPRIDADGSLSPEEEVRLYDYYDIRHTGLGGVATGTGQASGRHADETRGAAQGGTPGESPFSTSGGTSSGTGTGTSTGTASGTSTGMSSGSGSGIETGDPTDAALAGSGSATTGSASTGSATTGRGAVGHDTSGPTTDSAMTRSEEHLEVGTRTQESGRARLRKYVVTENETVTVPVSHEEVRLQTEPITDANAGAAMDGPAISEEEHEVVLHEEVPVVDKEARPVERVRLDTETVTGEERVSEDVRKERIELDGGTEATTGDEPRRRS